LKSLPVDYLKIDGQFVKDMADDPLDQAMVRCICEVAQVMNIKTVAEFVETQASLDALRVIGVHHAQGYWLHRPEPLSGLLAAQRQPGQQWLAS
jgi:diguanylate cyclase